MGIGTGYLCQPKTLHTGWWLGKEQRCPRAPQPSLLEIQVHRPLEKDFCDLTIGNMALMEADSALTIKWLLMCRARGRVSWGQFGKHSLILSTVHNVIQTYVHKNVATAQVIISTSVTHMAEMQRSGFLRHFPKETVNVTFWSSPRFLHWNFLDNSVAYFPMPGSNPNYMFTQSTWNSGFDQCVFSSLNKSWFSNLRQSF